MVSYAFSSVGSSSLRGHHLITKGLPFDHQGAYLLKMKSRSLIAWWQGKQLFIAASSVGLPFLSNDEYPQPPVAAYFFESLTINWRYVSVGEPATKDCSRPKLLLFSSDGT